jgi:hypothetical protein
MRIVTPPPTARAYDACYPDRALGGTAIVLTTEIRDVRLDDVLASAHPRRATVDTAVFWRSSPRTVADPSAGRPGGDRRVNFHHVGPVSGRISGPKSAVFPSPQPGTEGMFRVVSRSEPVCARRSEVTSLSSRRRTGTRWRILAPTCGRKSSRPPWRCCRSPSD